MAPKLPHWVTCPFRKEYKDNPRSKCFNCHAPKFMDCKYREEKSMQIAVINGPDFRPVCSKDKSIRCGIVNQNCYTCRALAQHYGSQTMPGPEAIRAGEVE